MFSTDEEWNNWRKSSALYVNEIYRQQYNMWKCEQLVYIPKPLWFN